MNHKAANLLRMEIQRNEQQCAKMNSQIAAMQAEVEHHPTKINALRKSNDNYRKALNILTAQGGEQE